MPAKRIKGKSKSKFLPSPQSRPRLMGVLLLSTFLIGWLAMPMLAAAHPLGNFTVNHYSRVEIGAAGVKVFYVLDMAEIPTFQEKDNIDLNHDGQISDSEKQAFAERKAKEIGTNLKLSLNDTPAELKLAAQDATFVQGQGGLQTLRLTARYETAALTNSTSRLTYQDNNFADRLGWKEVVVKNANGVALLQSSAPAKDQTNELRNYPQDMLASPLTLTTAQVAFKLDSSIVVKAEQGSTTAEALKSQDPFAALVNQELTIPLVLLAFVIAFGLGAVHALSPGHGKTVVAAYLVGTRGTARHALFLGAIVTITHTLGVFALGLITLFAAQFIVPEKLYPWLGLLSGLIVVLMGLSLFRSRLRHALVGAPASSQLVDREHDHSHEGHTHDHDHEHDNNHDGHTHDHETHDHAQVFEPALALVGHDQTEPSHESNSSHNYSEPEHDHHEHDHDHSHTEPEHDHSHDEHDHEHEHPEHEEGMHVHSHDGKAHSHLPPGADGSAVTWKRLLFFGISAGLLPCPSALVVMLSAIALNRTAFGLALIIFFSVGLAATLTGMGLLFVYARRLMNRFKISGNNKLLRLVPAGSALIVAIIGLVISYEALLQTGILNR